MYPNSLLTLVDGPGVNARVPLFYISLSLFSLSLSLLTLPPPPQSPLVLLPKFSLHRGAASTRQHRQHVNTSEIALPYLGQGMSRVTVVPYPYRKGERGRKPPS